jgi:lysophospholipid acyltransferase (LPLAT)-like uncharacterized protein
MKLRHPFLIRLLALLGSWVIRLWMGTLRLRMVCTDPKFVHPPDPDEERLIYTYWHEYLLFFVNSKTNTKARACTLVSQSADGELVARMASHLGMKCARGSTTEGGAKALLALRKHSRRHHIALNPDGPRGPRRRVHAGIIALASCTGLPILPCGVAYARAWRMRSWDRFALPWPWSTGYCVAMPRVCVPRRLDRAELERYRRLVEEQMLWATEAAERWAAAGTRTMPPPLTPPPCPEGEESEQEPTKFVPCPSAWQLKALRRRSA